AFPPPPVRGKTEADRNVSEGEPKPPRNFRYRKPLRGRVAEESAERPAADAHASLRKISRASSADHRREEQDLGHRGRTRKSHRPGHRRTEDARGRGTPGA